MERWENPREDLQGEVDIMGILGDIWGTSDTFGEGTEGREMCRGGLQVLTAPENSILAVV